MSYQDLEKLGELYKQGIVTQEEFEAEKKKILATVKPATADKTVALLDTKTDSGRKNYLIIMHLCQLISGFGAVISIVLWILKRQEHKQIDQHGRAIANWTLTMLLGVLVWWVFINMHFISNVPFILSVYQLIIPLFGFFAIILIIFPIIGAVKAAGGTLWKYPLSIPFLSIPTNETSEELLDDELVDNFNKK